MIGSGAVTVVLSDSRCNGAVVAHNADVLAPEPDSVIALPETCNVDSCGRVGHVGCDEGSSVMPTFLDGAGIGAGNSFV